jgi:site-specific recombinase XerC
MAAADTSVSSETAGKSLASKHRSNSAKMEKPTVKQHLACCSTWLVTGQVVATNRPTRSEVRSSSSRRARPQCSPENSPASSLTASTRQPLVSSRDRTVISVMTFAFARIGEVVGMRVEDYHSKGKHRHSEHLTALS